MAKGNSLPIFCEKIEEGRQDVNMHHRGRRTVIGEKKSATGSHLDQRLLGVKKGSVERRRVRDWRGG